MMWWGGRRESDAVGATVFDLDRAGEERERLLWRWQIWPQKPSGWMDPGAEESRWGRLRWLLRD